MSDNTDFGTFGRFTETPVNQMDADTKSAYDYTVKLRGLVPGPHKIWLANSKLSRTRRSASSKVTSIRSRPPT